ncbi:Crp/Fnr family transcriptional regulator [Siphonobacter aquaeclarae]|uniref:cAMP-binding domain of CRP or a regulatory subunit of cAMP-dependent protein kinases n=1 Tax=Siphonobacter aquaeclarae TaxID=563176 RepID=A0A1G9Y7M3_9BACT|nr:Crp/Fnr family transcriptional regulator [Siphonobacter aquaeclarae]SDN04535.1 cAMP-binding domain of CRP or a regulatory subunit of cAMP-dependent protein kinases [Siphonobacter aquaeclarae]
MPVNTLHNKLIGLIQTKAAFPPEDRLRCEKYFEPVSVGRNTVLEAAGKVPKHLYFIGSGYLRLWHVDERGEEITTHLNCPPGFFTSYSAFMDGAPAPDTVTSVTPCELLCITRANLQRFFDESAAMKAFGFHVFQEAIRYNENRSRELATLTAEQRYRRLMDDYPGILQNVPVQYIASFLGIKPESLSRIRRSFIP